MRDDRRATQNNIDAMSIASNMDCIRTPSGAGV